MQRHHHVSVPRQWRAHVPVKQAHGQREDLRGVPHDARVRVRGAEEQALRPRAVTSRRQPISVTRSRTNTPRKTRDTPSTHQGTSPPARAAHQVTEDVAGDQNRDGELIIGTRRH